MSEEAKVREFKEFWSKSWNVNNTHDASQLSFEAGWEAALRQPTGEGHVHTSACYGKVPESEGSGEYLRCGKVAGATGQPLIPRCQARSEECGQCELREGHDGKHLAGYLMWEGDLKGGPERAATPATVAGAPPELGACDVVSRPHRKDHCAHPPKWLATPQASETALREAVIEEVAAFLEQPYPASVFTPLSDGEVEQAVAAMGKVVRNASDRLHASWARHWAKLIRSQFLATQHSGQQQPK